MNVVWPKHPGLLCLVSAVIILSGCSAIPQESELGYETLAPSMFPRPEQDTGSLYQPGYDLVLFEDLRAARVGDIIQVLLVEQTNAAKTSKTEIDKNGASTLPVPTVFGRTPADLNLGITSGHEFGGEGKSNQSNSLSGSIAVTVSSVLPNGNMRVQGEKWIKINQGSEYIRIKGIIRPSDVRADNTVLSTHIADAKISYGGRGALDEANTSSWATRLFMSPLWPF